MNGEVRTQRIADAIAERIEQMILQGVLRPGERLASERDLAQKLAVSRPSLREALASLEQRGLIVGGRGGATVAPFLKPFSAPLGELFADKPRVTADYFEFRRVLEARASGLAARRATEPDRKAIAAILARMKAAHEIDDPHEEADADVDLHIAVYEAAHNIVFLHVMRVLAELLREGVLYNRDQLYRRAGARDLLLAQHVAIAEAVLAGDADAAERAADAHIRFPFETVEEIRRDRERLETSLSRLDRADLVARVGAVEADA